ncbi:MAG: ATP-binding protein, partial [Lachnospiraceae bacterium]|nr:ATP-binding protein [Lachnospiraceae bacterium]
MSKMINTWRDPYGEGFSICSRKQIEFRDGLTVLVGCNGCGKTTTIRNIKEQLDDEGIPCYTFDNLTEGGSRSVSEAISSNNIAWAATAWRSSEGENISMHVAKMAADMRRFLETGDTPRSLRSRKWAKLFHDGEEEEKPVPDERWILLDAVDSGYSIDNIIELKDFFGLLMEEAERFGRKLYIIAAANEYELAKDGQCLDVTTGRYMEFPSYKDYREFIIKSREKKDRREERKRAKEAAPVRGRR